MKIKKMKNSKTTKKKWELKMKIVVWRCQKMSYESFVPQGKDFSGLGFYLYLQELDKPVLHKKTSEKSGQKDR